MLKAKIIEQTFSGITVGLELHGLVHCTLEFNTLAFRASFPFLNA